MFYAKYRAPIRKPEEGTVELRPAKKNFLEHYSLLPALSGALIFFVPAYELNG